MIVILPRIKYTQEMEKAMQKAHGIGYKEYCRKLDCILTVEKQREKDYNLSRKLVQK